ncbi:MAG: hypothetical protein ABI587_12075 [Gemmatimonadales bacterium]
MTRRLLLPLGLSLGLALLAWGVQAGLRPPQEALDTIPPLEAPAASVEPGTEPRAPEIGFRDPGQLAEHFHKHGAEFGGITQMEYLRRAQQLRDRSAGGDILEAVREDGVITRFDRREGDFLAVDPDRIIRTFFRPKDGEAYYQRQLKRGQNTR